MPRTKWNENGCADVNGWRLFVVNIYGHPPHWYWIASGHVAGLCVGGAECELRKTRAVARRSAAAWARKAPHGGTTEGA